MDKKKVKQVVFITGAAMLGMFIVNSIANRVPAVKSINDKIKTGV